MKVTLYTIPNDPFCKQAKDYFTSQSVTFVEKDVQSDKDALAEMLAASNKFAGVPCCVVEKDNGEKAVLKGFTQSDYEQALGVTAAAPAAPSDVAPALSEMDKTADTVSETNMSVPPVSAPDAPRMDMPTSTSADVMQSPVAPMGVGMSASSTMDTPAPSTPATPSMDSVVGMPSDTPAPAMPAMDVSAPVSPVAPVMPAVPAAAEPMDPQDELSGLLKDLESKVTPDAAPVAPVAPLHAGMSSAAPVAPAMASMDGTSTPAAAAPADLPDFNQTQS